MLRLPRGCICDCSGILEFSLRREEFPISFSRLLRYLKSWPNLLLDLLDSPPNTELLLFIYDGTTLIPNYDWFWVEFLLCSSNNWPNFRVYCLYAIFGLVRLFICTLLLTIGLFLLFYTNLTTGISSSILSLKFCTGFYDLIYVFIGLFIIFGDRFSYTLG